ncbi:MAG TPA: hypothetical protein VLV49_02645 [Terriglobales bacterium]|nr:hypothetical protein [Terriglobales bacterium]
MIRRRGEVLVLGHNRTIKLLLEKAAKEAVREQKAREKRRLADGRPIWEPAEG